MQPIKLIKEIYKMMTSPDVVDQDDEQEIEYIIFQIQLNNIVATKNFVKQAVEFFASGYEINFLVKPDFEVYFSKESIILQTEVHKDDLELLQKYAGRSEGLYKSYFNELLEISFLIQLETKVVDDPSNTRK